MEAPKEKPKVKLIEEDGNAYMVMTKVSKALREAGADKEYIKKYFNDSMSGDYNHLLGVAMEYVDII